MHASELARGLLGRGIPSLVAGRVALFRHGADIAFIGGIKPGVARKRHLGRGGRFLPAVAPAEGKGRGSLPVGPAYVEIDSIEMMPFSSITSAEVRHSGETDRESLRKRAAHPGPIFDATLLYRVEFHLVDKAG